MILQGRCPSIPYRLCNYRSHDILLWIMIILAVIMAFFLLREYFNTRKSYHLMWSSALIFTFIVFHQVANTDSYLWLFESVGTGFMIIIPGLIATGLLLSTFESKPLIGRIYLLCIAIMAIGTTIIGLPYYQSSWGIGDWFRISLMTVPSIISLGVMLVIPLYTTLISKETTSKAYFTVIAAVLLIIWSVAYLLAMSIFADTTFLFVVFGLFPFIFMFSMVLFVLGMMYEPKWKFDIPGVELDEEERIEKLTFQKSQPLISSARGIAGGILLILGTLLAAWIFASSEIIMGITIGILMIAGLIGIMVGFAVLIGWDAVSDANTVIRIGLGLVALVFAIILIILPSTPPAVFVAPEGGAIWATISPVLIFAGAISILVSGILSQFIIKE